MHGFAHCRSLAPQPRKRARMPRIFGAILGAFSGRIREGAPPESPCMSVRADRPARHRARESASRVRRGSRTGNRPRTNSRSRTAPTAAPNSRRKDAHEPPRPTPETGAVEPAETDRREPARTDRPNRRRCRDRAPPRHRPRERPNKPPEGLTGAAKQAAETDARNGRGRTDRTAALDAHGRTGGRNRRRDRRREAQEGAFEVASRPI